MDKEISKAKAHPTLPDMALLLLRMDLPSLPMETPNQGMESLKNHKDQTSLKYLPLNMAWDIQEYRPMFSLMDSLKDNPFPMEQTINSLKWMEWIILNKSNISILRSYLRISAQMDTFPV